MRELNQKITKILLLVVLLAGVLPNIAKADCWGEIELITSVEPYDDVRCKDMSQLDLSDSPNLPATLWFNQETIWPAPDRMPAGCDPEQIMTDAMNPGLGVRSLHQQGITGAGISVAIIDQPMYLDHPEFTGKVAAYYDLAPAEQSSMHGPAVTSLLAGENCGTAPDARVYYCAARGGVYEVDYAQALDWIIRQNETLSESEKIRVVSVSAAPGDVGYPSETGEPKWSDARNRAEAAGILVLDVTRIVLPCWYDANDPENVAKCTPGFPGMDPWFDPEGICVPLSPRTTAEEVYQGDFSYQYTGRGGISWSIPYCAGVLAMGWQIRPELTGEQIVDLLFDSAYVNDDGARIINPPAFINSLQQPIPINEFDDVCNQDLSGYDFSNKPDLIDTLTFNQETIWPEPAQMPPGCDPDQIMTDGMNPGLGVRSLHQKGITGAGINVAIIDQPIIQTHPEYNGKIAAYYDVGCGGSETSMHGPAMTSLLVGENCGTAPDAQVYYVAAPSWHMDAAYYADALDWIVTQNESLPGSDKIRVVSVSAQPSGLGSLYSNQEMWDAAVANAQSAGILVLDCTWQHGFVSLCWYDANDPENVSRCTPGFRDGPVEVDAGHIHAPTAPRTQAEEHSEGNFGYIYGGGSHRSSRPNAKNGYSDAIPYCAGILAMGWQIQPELTGEQMHDLLFASAYVNDDGAQIINPPAFINLLLENKPVIQLSNDEFEFYADSNGPNPDPQILSISNSGLGTLNWAINETCDWFQVNPSSGISTGQDDINEVTLSITELPLGVHTCQLTISDPCATNNPQIVSITLYVSDANAQTTIQGMIDTAEDGDTVIIDPGVYIGDGNRDLDFKGKAITVRSVDPNDPDVVASTIIICQGSESEPHRGFYFHNNEEADSVLAGFTITQGYQSRGGGIYCEHSSPTISNCALVDNSADCGGGMHNFYSSAKVVNCIFIGNSAVSWGGGMTNRDCTGSLTVTKCTFNGNSASWGGGMRNYTSSTTVINCTFSNNSAQDWEGGGMSNRDGGNPTLINCTFCGNSSILRGGGIYSDENSFATVSNCILWKNRDEGGTDERAQIDSDGPVPLISYSCVQSWMGDLGGIGNTGANPLFADAENGDYHLKSQGGRWNPNTQTWVVDDVTSPCIDAGDPNMPVRDEPFPSGIRINMGAYGGTTEASKSISDIPEVVNVNYSDNGSQVTLKQGQILAVTLESNPTTGYSWYRIEKQDSIFKKFGDTLYFPSEQDDETIGAGG